MWWLSTKRKSLSIDLTKIEFTNTINTIKKAYDILIEIWISRPTSNPVHNWNSNKPGFEKLDSRSEPGFEKLNSRSELELSKKTIINYLRIKFKTWVWLLSLVFRKPKTNNQQLLRNKLKLIEIWGEYQVWNPDLKKTWKRKTWK